MMKMMVKIYSLQREPFSIFLIFSPHRNRVFWTSGKRTPKEIAIPVDFLKTVE